jgi:beta propeller repeat protein
MKGHFLRGLCVFFILTTTLIAVGCSQQPSTSRMGEFAIRTGTKAVQVVIWQDIVAWTAVTGNSYYDLTTETRGYNLSTGREFYISNRSAGDISGNIIVWSDERNSHCNWETCDNADIYGYNISSDKEFPICTSHSNQWSPAIAGNIVVWQDYRNASSNFNTYFDIYGYNISSGKEFPICTEDGAQEWPDISGNIVVWLDGRKGNIIDTYGYGNDIYDIYGYNISSGTEFPVCINSSAQYCPSISGNIVVWEDYRNGYFNPDIYGYDISSGKEFPICTANGTQELPDISGNIVVWQDNRNGKTAVYGYDLSNGEEFPICTNPAEQYSPHISGNYVVWIDGRNGSSIYGARLTFDNQ